MPTLLAALQWVHMLLRKSGPRVMQLSQQIWPALFTCLSNASEEVVRLDIEALARMAPTEEHFGPLVEHLLQIFRKVTPQPTPSPKPPSSPSPSPRPSPSPSPTLAPRPPGARAS